MLQYKVSVYSTWNILWVISEVYCISGLPNGILGEFCGHLFILLSQEDVITLLQEFFPEKIKWLQNSTKIPSRIPVIDEFACISGLPIGILGKLCCHLLLQQKKLTAAEKPSEYFKNYCLKNLDLQNPTVTSHGILAGKAADFVTKNGILLPKLFWPTVFS